MDLENKDDYFQREKVLKLAESLGSPDRKSPGPLDTSAISRAASHQPVTPAKNLFPEDGNRQRKTIDY